MSDDERYADWLANCVHGYGFGYTEAQALAAMAKNVPGETGAVTVDLVEHHGNATIGPATWDVEEFVSGRRIEIPAERINELRDRAHELERATDAALVNAETVEEFEDSE